MVEPTFAQRLSVAAHRGLDHANPLPAQALHELVEWVVAQSPKRVLDVGCGGGSTAIELAARGQTEVIGLDTNPAALDQASRRAEGRQLRGTLRWHFGGLPTLESASAFDVLWCMGSSQAFGGPWETLRQAHEWLRPDGLMVLGELEWRNKPTPEFLDALGMHAADLWCSADAEACLAREGWRIERRVAADADAMQHYEHAVERGRLMFAEEIEASDPAGASRVRAQVKGWRELIHTHGAGWTFSAYGLRRSS